MTRPLGPSPGEPGSQEDTTGKDSASKGAETLGVALPTLTRGMRALRRWLYRQDALNVVRGNAVHDQIPADTDEAPPADGSLASDSILDDVARLQESKARRTSARVHTVHGDDVVRHNAASLSI